MKKAFGIFGTGFGVGGSAVKSKTRSLLSGFLIASLIFGTAAPLVAFAEDTISVSVTGVTLGEHTATLTIGATDQLAATVAPTDATNKAVTYISSDDTIASVDSSGLVTANAAGSATITVTTTDGNFPDTDVITVNAAAPVTIANVSNVTDLNAAIADTNIATINFTADITTDAQILVQRSLTINGQGHTLLKDSTTNLTVNGLKHTLFVSTTLDGGGVPVPGVVVAINNLTVDANSKSYGVQAYDSATLNLNTVTIKNSKGAGLTVNAATITATALTTTGNAWGAVNVDYGIQPYAQLPSTFTLNSGTLGETVQIWSDEKASGGPTITVNATGYSFVVPVPGGTTYWSSRIATVDITAFDAISNIDGGVAGSATYADAAAVEAHLPTSVTANSGAVSVPVASWTDTSTYSASAAGTYTFTAVLGTIPDGFTNSGNLTATVNVVVAASVGGGSGESQTATPAIITPIYAGATSVSGTSEDNASISLTINGGTAQTATADASGNWTVTGLTLATGNAISVTATGNSETASAAVTATVAAPSITFVNNLQPSYTASGGGGVYSVYYGPNDGYAGDSPGTTAVYDGREAAPIYAGVNANTTAADSSTPAGVYEDQGLFGFKPGDVPVTTFATQPLTYDFENQYGTAPVWVYIELNKGIAGDTMYQYVPTSNPSGWHTEDAATGAHWQAWTNTSSGVTTGPMLSLADIAAANPSKTVSRIYLTEGMGDSYHSTPNGTVAWVDTATIGGTTYNFVAANLVLIAPATASIAQSTLVPETNGKANDNSAVDAVVTAGLLPVAVTLENTGGAASSNMRINPIGASSHIQLWAKDTSNNWYDINVTGWGPAEGFSVPAHSGPITTNVYAVSDIAGSYPLTTNVVDVANSAIVATVAGIVTVNAPADTIPPVITLNGDNTVTVAQGSTYTDAGATASDNVDGNITAKIVTVNPVNTADVGTYTVTYNVSDAAGNAATEVDRTVHVAKADQTISFGSLADKTYGIVGFTIDAQASSDLGVNFTAQGDCTVSDGLGTASVLITEAGSCTVTAHQVGDDNYNAAPDVSQTFNIAPAPLTITADDQSKVYGASDPALTTSYSGFVAGNTAASLTTPVSIVRATGDNVGSYAITASGAVDSNYAITYVPGTLTINHASATITLGDLSQGYDGTAKSATVTTNPSSLSASVTYDGSATAPTSVGSYAVVATITNSNYTGTANGTLVIADVTSPVISLTGDSSMTVAQGSTFTDPGATATDDVDVTDSVSVSGTVNTATDGTYTLTYNASDAAGNHAAPVTRTVHVTDQTAPVIASHSNFTAEATSASGDTVTYTSPATSDNVDVAGTASCSPTSGSTFALGVHTVTCNATDEAGNHAIPTAFTVTVHDTTTPVITLAGASSIDLAINNAFTDPGATATDAVDGTDAVMVSGTVNTAVAGTYTLTYNTSDAAGNTATPVTRTVIIEAAALPLTITTPDESPLSRVATIPSATEASTTSNGITATFNIPAGTTITGTSAWDGSLTLPIATTTYTAPSNSGFNDSVVSAIEMGAGNTPLTFSKGVRIVFAGQAGTLVGWSQNGVFTPITATCSADTQTVGDALVAGGDCTINSGSDLIVWTKHFTTFITYTQAAIPAPVSSGGGGGPVGLVGTTNGGTGVGAAVIPTVPTGTGSTGGEVLGASAYQFSANLTTGSTGNDVTELQKVLIAEGDLSIGAPTGVFGPLTKAAVIKYQMAHKISPQSGYVGSMTRGVLGQGSEPTTPEVTGAVTYNFATNLTIGSTGADVTALQNLLTKTGNYTGPVTSYFGALTKAAVQKYQTRHNVSAVGSVGPMTRAALNKGI